MKPSFPDSPLPATCRLGWGSLDDVGKDAARLGGTTALIVTSQSLADSPTLHAVTRRLEAAGLDMRISTHATESPDVEHAEDGRALFGDDCDIIVSVGGGNTHDLAKVIGVLARNEGPVRRFAGKDKVRVPTPPHIAVNTTAGSGSELSRYAIITDHQLGRRLVIDDGHITPRVAINDPSTHESMPPMLTAMSGMNVLTHAIESHLGPHGTALTNAMALDAIDLTSRYLERATIDGHDEDARSAMAQAEQLAGIAYNATGLGLADAISLGICAVFDVPHGACNAVVLPYVLAYDSATAESRLADIGRAFLGDEAPEDDKTCARQTPAAIEAFARRLHLPPSLRHYGIEDDVGYLTVRNVLEGPFTHDNPRLADADGIENILVEAVVGTPIEAAFARLAR